jgi:hypothetical protein
LPIFQLKSNDLNRDYLKYVVEICKSNSWPCTNGAITYDQTSAQTCWKSQDAQTNTAYNSGYTLPESSMAYCEVPTSDILTPSTSYFMRAKATDPGGSNTYSGYSSVISFTTGALDIKITGSTNITGNTQIGGN